MITKEDISQISLDKHRELKGKVEVVSRVEINSNEDLSIYYTPGVASPCLEIQRDNTQSFNLTRRGNLIAIITDGSAVLGLGNIGASAAMPVMEGKAALLKNFANVDSYPMCLETNDIDEIVNAIILLRSNFSAILLEDISAPRCFEIEDRLKQALDIPVFHDDQHGTAICVCSALINALRVVNKEITEVKVVLNGPGAAGTATLKMLSSLGVKHIIAADENGILSLSKEAHYDSHKKRLLSFSNPENIEGNLADAIKGADVFIGTSVGGCVSPAMVSTMNKDAIIFACANPTPEIYPELALAAGARIVSTGRSDYPNQLNNLLVFPGVFKGLLDAKATTINDEMMVDVVYALANCIEPHTLSENNILPSVFNKEIVKKISECIVDSSKRQGLTRP